jgi:hypothetical protein
VRKERKGRQKGCTPSSLSAAPRLTTQATFFKDEVQSLMSFSFVNMHVLVSTSMQKMLTDTFPLLRPSRRSIELTKLPQTHLTDARSTDDWQQLFDTDFILLREFSEAHHGWV